MTQRNILFEDNIQILSIDKDGKVFDKVSRFEARADDTECKIQMDFNSEIYPISKNSVYSIMITKSVYSEGSPKKFDYVIHGKIFKYSEESDGKVSVYASFGGLLLRITGEPSHLNNLGMDERIYLMMKKIE